MSQIDAKDLCVGSLIRFEDHEVRKVIEISTDGFIRTYSDSKKQGYNFTSVKHFSPIVLTAGILEEMGGHNLTASLGRPCYGFVPEADGPMPPDIIHVEPFESLWVLAYDGHVIKVLNGVHHLQALVWQLERVWLTIQPVPA